MRHDGAVFDEYSRNSRGGEKWFVSQEGFGAEKNKNRRLRRLRTTPESLAARSVKQKAAYRERADIRIKARARTKKWRLSNPFRSRAAISKWAREKYRNDPEFRRKMSLAGKLRRERIAGRHTAKCADVRVYGTTCPERRRGTKKLIERIYRHAANMRIGFGIKHEIDHIIPLCSGGLHVEGNLQILTADINRSKGSNPFWMSPDGLSLDWRDVPQRLWPENLRPEYERLIALHPKPVHAVRTKFNGRPFSHIAA